MFLISHSNGHDGIGLALRLVKDVAASFMILLVYSILILRIFPCYFYINF